MVNNLPTMQKTWSGRSPGEGNGYHFCILAWRIPWTEEPGGLQSMGLLQRVGHESTTNTFVNGVQPLKIVNHYILYICNLSNIVQQLYKTTTTNNCGIFENERGAYWEVHLNELVHTSAFVSGQKKKKKCLGI